MRRRQAIKRKTLEKRRLQHSIVPGANSMAARETSWASFMTDEEWLRVRTESEVDGPLVTHAENRFMTPTDFSPLS